jgi:hypothetical protein
VRGVAVRLGVGPAHAPRGLRPPRPRDSAQPEGHGWRLSSPSPASSPNAIRRTSCAIDVAKASGEVCMRLSHGAIVGRRGTRVCSIQVTTDTNRRALSK